MEPRETERERSLSGRRAFVPFVVWYLGHVLVRIDKQTTAAPTRHGSTQQGVPSILSFSGISDFRLRLGFIRNPFVNIARLLFHLVIF